MKFVRSSCCFTELLGKFCERTVTGGAPGLIGKEVENEGTRRHHSSSFLANIRLSKQRKEECPTMRGFSPFSMTCMSLENSNRMGPVSEAVQVEQDTCGNSAGIHPVMCKAVRIGKKDQTWPLRSSKDCLTYAQFLEAKLMLKKVLRV